MALCHCHSCLQKNPAGFSCSTATVSRHTQKEREYNALPTTSHTQFSLQELSQGLSAFLNPGATNADILDDSDSMSDQSTSRSDDFNMMNLGQDSNGPTNTRIGDGTTGAARTNPRRTPDSDSDHEDPGVGGGAGADKDKDEDEEEEEDEDEDEDMDEDRPDPGCARHMEHDEQDTSSPPSNPPTPEYHIDAIKISRQFIQELENASVSKLPPSIQNQVKQPKRCLLTLSDSERLSVDVFLAVSNASQGVYNAVRDSIHRRYPDAGMMSYHEVEKFVQRVTGIVTVEHDMCINSCIGYTGPFSELTHCPYCGERRYIWLGGKKARKLFHTIPIGPQLQAMWRSREGAEGMEYRRTYTTKVFADLTESPNGQKSQPYGDLFDGGDYLDAVIDGWISDSDMVLMFSIDGAQLYRMKSSDCWIYIWIIMDLAPDQRYKKKRVLPGGFVPGPGKPKNLDSFLFPGLFHLAAIQKDGLAVWSAKTGEVFTSYPFLALVTTDAPAMATISGMVGHHGKYACRLYCPLPGRHPVGGSHYYPVRFKPLGYTVDGCDHGDISLPSLLKEFTSASARTRYEANLALVESSSGPTIFNHNRLETGIVRPSIFLGLPARHRFPVPSLFPGDNMHLPALNITDLFFPLWRGTMECEKTDNKADWTWMVLRGDVWKNHGKQVAAATPWYPGSFDRPPRNPAEKISSGYKAWEFLLYFYGIGPALLHGILPDEFWRHYCKVVRAVRITLQAEISSDELQEADKLFTEFSDEYEQLYVQRRADRMHFVRQSIHTPSHSPHEVVRLGLGGIYSQWTIERTIGNLGEEVKQHSNAFANFEQRGILRCTTNALKAALPDLDPDADRLPRGAVDLGRRYVLLPAVDNCPRPIRSVEANAIRAYLVREGDPDAASWTPKVIRWARLNLPSGQTARTEWKEGQKDINEVRCSRHVKIIQPDLAIYFAEVLFFMMHTIAGTKHHIAVVHPFGNPVATLLQASSKTYWTAQKLEDSHVCAIKVETIDSVVMIAPNENYTTESGVDHWYMTERPGLKLATFMGYSEGGDND